MAQPGSYSVANNTSSKADIRLKLVVAALNGACAANNGSAALYTAAQAATYALACADATIAALVAEG